MPPKKPFKLDAQELKFGCKNIPTLEESLKHGLFVRETRHRNTGRIERRETIARDTAVRIQQIWIQDLGIPERCLRSIESVLKQITQHLTRLTTLKSLKNDLKEVWLAKLGTIIDLLRCRCQISSNATLRSDLYELNCNCQNMHKIPYEKLDFLYQQRERSESHFQAALAVIHDKRQKKNLGKKLREEETLRLKKENRDAWNKIRIKQKEKEKAEKKRKDFNEWMDKYGWQYKIKHEPNREEPEQEIPQLGEKRNFFQAVEEEEEEEGEHRAGFCKASQSSPLISEIEVDQNPIKTEVEQVEEVAAFVETFPSLNCDTFSTKRVYKVVKRRKHDEATDAKTCNQESDSNWKPPQPSSSYYFFLEKVISKIQHDHNYGIKTILEDSKAGVSEADSTSLISMKSEFEDDKFDGSETDVISQICIKTESKEFVDESGMEEDPLKIKDEPLDYLCDIQEDSITEESYSLDVLS